MSSDTPREVNQKLGELASQWRTAGSIQKGVTQAVNAAYALGLAAKSAEVERLQFALEVAQKAQFKPDAALVERVEELENRRRELIIERDGAEKRVEELEDAIKSVLQWQDLGGDLGVDLTQMLVKTLERK